MADRQDTKLFILDPKKKKESMSSKLYRLLERAVVSPRPVAPKEQVPSKSSVVQVADRFSEQWTSEPTQTFSLDPYAHLDKLVQPVKDMKVSRTGIKYWLLSFPGHTETRVVEDYMEKSKLRGATMKEITDMIESDYDAFRDHLPLVALGSILAERDGRYVPYWNRKGRRWELNKLRYDLTEWSSEFHFLAFAI